MTKTLIAVLALTLAGCAVDYTSIEYTINSEGESKASIRADKSKLEKSTAQDASMPGAALEGFIDALKPDATSIVEKIQVPVEEIAEPEGLEDAPAGQIEEIE